eukprot:TRINITY_DN17387_c0_g1_i1.p1 TRINITY_DN17387_c0_g1~~TRINITY_DN17387_c0_g1_i1.p1  ORF type:complete len:279 (+),score=29.29 TRINITY_DN17387_c0_g1_i1:37-873(+)
MTYHERAVRFASALGCDLLFYHAFLALTLGVSPVAAPMLLCPPSWRRLRSVLCLIVAAASLVLHRSTTNGAAHASSKFSLPPQAAFYAIPAFVAHFPVLRLARQDDSTIGLLTCVRSHIRGTLTTLGCITGGAVAGSSLLLALYNLELFEQLFGWWKPAVGCGLVIGFATGYWLAEQLNLDRRVRATGVLWCCLFAVLVVLRCDESFLESNVECLALQCPFSATCISFIVAHIYSCGGTCGTLRSFDSTGPQSPVGDANGNNEIGEDDEAEPLAIKVI